MRFLDAVLVLALAARYIVQTGPSERWPGQSLSVLTHGTGTSSRPTSAPRRRARPLTRWSPPSPTGF